MKKKSQKMAQSCWNVSVLTSKNISVCSTAFDCHWRKADTGTHVHTPWESQVPKMEAINHCVSKCSIIFVVINLKEKTGVKKRKKSSLDSQIFKYGQGEGPEYCPELISVYTSGFRSVFEVCPIYSSCCNYRFGFGSYVDTLYYMDCWVCDISSL